MKKVQSSEFKVQSETVGVYGDTPLQPNTIKITRRGFLGFFVLGGLMSLFHRKVNDVIKIEDGQKEAMFWRKTNESK